MLIQKQYEDYDQRSLTIKGWISGGAVAGLALGLNGAAPIGPKNPEVWLLLAIIPAVFWYLEARWKMFQYALRRRIQLIEAHFRNDEDVIVKNPAPFQTYEWWFYAYQNSESGRLTKNDTGDGTPIGRWFAAARQDFVYLPYLPIIAIFLFMYSR